MNQGIEGINDWIVFLSFLFSYHSFYILETRFHVSQQLLRSYHFISFFIFSRKLYRHLRKHCSSTVCFYVVKSKVHQQCSQAFVWRLHESLGHSGIHPSLSLALEKLVPARSDPKSLQIMSNDAFLREDRAAAFGKGKRMKDRKRRYHELDYYSINLCISYSL